MTKTSASIRIYVLRERPKIYINGVLYQFSKTDAHHLLLYLADQGSQTYERSRLSSSLYSEDDIALGGDDEKARAKLREALSFLRSKVGLQEQFSDGAEPDILRFSSQHVWIDSRAFYRQAKKLLEKSSWDDQSTIFARLHTLALYRSHFLNALSFKSPGLSEWHAHRQAELAQMRHKLLEHAVKFFIVCGDLRQALRCAVQWHESAVEVQDAPCAPLQYIVWLAANQGDLGTVERTLQQIRQCEKQGGFVFRLAEEWRRNLQMGERLPTSLLPLYDTSPAKTLQLIERGSIQHEMVSALVNAPSPLVMALVGLPGVGKTALAAAVVAEMPHSIPVVRVELTRLVDYETLITDMLIQLGMTHVELMSMHYTAKQRQLRRFFKTRRHLVVIDEGATTSLENGEFLKPLLTLFEQAHVFLIGRTVPDTTPDFDFYTIKLGGLKADGIRQLFLTQTAKALPPDLAVFEQVARLTGGLPLALKLIIGSLNDNRFQLHTLATQLQAFDSVNAETVYSIYERLLDWVWGQLVIGEIELMYRLSLYDPVIGATVDEIAALETPMFKHGRERFETKLKTLQALALIQSNSETQRYHLHPVVRQFVQSRAALPKERSIFEPIERAYLERCLRYALTYRDTPSQLDEQRENIVWSLERVLTGSNQERYYAQAVEVLDTISTYLQQRGYSTLLDRLFTNALEGEGTATLAPSMKARLLANAGQSAFKQGEFDRANIYLDEASNLVREEELVDLYAVILRDLGRICIQHADFDRALLYLEQGAQVAQSQNQLALYGQIQANVGVIARMRGRSEEALHEFFQLLDVLGDETHDDISNEVLDVVQFVLNAIGLIEVERENHISAEQYFQRSLVALRRVGNLERMGYVYLNLGTSHYMRGKLTEANEAFQAGNAIAETLQHDELFILFSLNRGIIQMVQYQYETAHQHLQTALDQAQKISLTWIIPRIGVTFGILHFRQYHLEQARRYFVQVITQTALSPQVASEALYGLMLTFCYEQGSLSGSVLTVEQVNYTFVTHGIGSERLRGIDVKEFAKAEKYFQRALDTFPNLARYGIVETLTTWQENHS